VLHVVLHLHDEAVRELGVRGARVDEGGAGREVLEAAHLLVELDGVLCGVRLVQREAHGDAHPEVLGHLEGVAVAALDAVAVVERDDADVLEQLVVGGLEGGGERGEVEELDEAGVEESLVDAAAHVGLEVAGVEGLELLGGGVVAEHALVDGLEQEAGGYDVERRVVFHVLQRHLDDGLVELLGRDAVEERELEFGGDLRDPGDVVVEADGGVLDRQVDLVGVVRLSFAVALYYCDSHECSSETAQNGPRSRRRLWLFNHYISGH
jgi:hypothetical protein